MCGTPGLRNAGLGDRGARCYRLLRVSFNLVATAMPDGDDAILFSAILRPHRSGGRLVGRAVLAVAAVIWLPIAAVVATIGAWPVLPFLGLELALLALALGLSRRSGNAIEAITLSRQVLTVRRLDHWGTETSISFAPHWLQVIVETVDEDNNRLVLRSHGQSLTIARFLLPHERVALARALRRELARVRPAARAA